MSSVYSVAEAKDIVSSIIDTYGNGEKGLDETQILRQLEFEHRAHVRIEVPVLRLLLKMLELEGRIAPTSIVHGGRCNGCSRAMI